MGRQRTINVLLNPELAKDVDEFSTFVPLMRILKNVRRNDLGILKKRPGYQTHWDTTRDVPVNTLIPKNYGYAITDDGKIFSLGGVRKTKSIVQIFDGAPAQSRPRWVENNKNILIADGGSIKELNTTTNAVEFVSGLPNAKFITVINDYALYAGYDDYEFTSSVPSNLTSVDTSFGARTYNIQKTGTIQNAIDHDENFLIFKEEEIEVWSFRGADPPFVRHVGAKIDKGLGAVNSLVKADGRLWWFGHDGNFYSLTGFVWENISLHMKKEFDTSTDSTKWEGHHISKENLIMWINRISGQTLSYDYNKKQWLDDGWWKSGGNQALPFSSYMELDNRQFFGSARYDGLIHEWSYDYKSDNGDPIRVVKEFAIPLSQQGFRGRVHRFNFRREANQAIASNAAPVFMVRTNFDGNGWSEYEHLTLGVSGDNMPYALMNRVGLGREVVVEIIETDNVDFLLTHLYVTVERMKN